MTQIWNPGTASEPQTSQLRRGDGEEAKTTEKVMTQRRGLPSPGRRGQDLAVPRGLCHARLTEGEEERTNDGHHAGRRTGTGAPLSPPGSFTDRVSLILRKLSAKEISIDLLQILPGILIRRI